MGIEGVPQSPYGSMSFEDLIKDPVAGPIVEQKALEYLMKNNEFFRNEFSGEMDEEGYLLRKDGTNSNTKPSQNISNYMEVLEMVRAELQ